MQPKFKRYASTNARLLSHLDRLKEIREKRRILPITVEIAPTDACNLNCDWCSVKDREGTSLDIEQVKEAIDTYVRWGAKSFEFTGGGDPLMYPHIEEVVDYAYKKTGAVGLITNGVGLSSMPNLREFTKKLMWMRISLSGLDFGATERYLEINPDDIQTFMGCSYLIFHNEENPYVDIRNALAGKVAEMAKFLGAEYVRIIPNCNDTNQIRWLQRYGESLIRGLPNFFVQAKDYWVPKVCYWRYIKPFVNSDGWVYQCSTCSLFERRFPEAWRVTTIDNIDEIYATKRYGFRTYLGKEVTSFDTSSCKLCFFNHQNHAIGDLLTEVVHKEFV